MKVLLLSPVKNPEIKKPKGIMMPQLALHLIAGLTPGEHEVKIVEEEIEEVDLESDCDLVGISCMTANAPRAYKFAAEFRKRGKMVVLGGVHPTILPEEALQYCDAVVIGEAEGVWKEVLKDAEGKKLQRRYHQPHPSLEEYIPIRHRLMTKKRLFNVLPVMTTRGCPYNCDFCCVHDIFGKKIRHVPIPNVVRDLEESGGKFFMFLDDNIIGDKRYAKELFRAIKPLKIKWVGQSSISFVNDLEMMKLAVDSGCTALFFGVETVSALQAEKMRKSFKDMHDTETAIKKIQDNGVHFHPSMIFGFDTDTKDIFKETVDFLFRNHISTASMNILTPYPGTRTYEQLKTEGRLLTKDWQFFNHNTAVFQPKNMSADDLNRGRLWAVKEFSSFNSTLRRLPFHLKRPHYHLAVNWACLKSVKNEIRYYPRVYEQLFNLPVNGMPA